MDIGHIGNVIFQLILAMVGGIVGGVLTILGNRFSARREQVKFAREWYEREYITDGIEPLTSYYTSLDNILRSRSSEDYAPEPLPESSAFPIAALNRLRGLFHDDKLALIEEYIENQLFEMRYYVPSETLFRNNAYYKNEEELGKVVRELRDGLIHIGADLRKQINVSVHDRNANLDSSYASRFFADMIDNHRGLKFMHNLPNLLAQLESLAKPETLQE